MKCIIGMPLRVYSGFLGRLPLDSREYAVLETAVIESNTPRNTTVEIFCDKSRCSAVAQSRYRVLSRGAAIYSVGHDQLRGVIGA